jgi:hypothetical protein
MSFLPFKPTKIQLTLSEVQGLPAPSRERKELIIDLTGFFKGHILNCNPPQLWEVITETSLNENKRTTRPIHFGSLILRDDTKATWNAYLSGFDLTSRPYRTTEFSPVAGGLNSEQGPRMLIMFRLAKMFIRDGYRVQIRLPKALGGLLVSIDGMPEDYFVTEICERGVTTGGTLKTTVPPKEEVKAEVKEEVKEEESGGRPAVRAVFSTRVRRDA